MKIAYDLSDIPTLEKNYALTLGSFDGVHTGHRYLLEEMRRLAPNHPIALLSFINQPAEILNKKYKTTLLSTLEHKTHLLEQAGVDLLILLKFDQELAEMPYDVFLNHLKTATHFSDFFLGKGASFGHKKKGDEQHVTALEKLLGFRAHYLTKKNRSQEVISSRHIRGLIHEGSLDKAQELLGRPYSIYTSFRAIDHSFIPPSVVAKNLCLPPKGAYPVTIIDEEKSIPGSLQIDPKKHELLLQPVDADYRFTNLFLEVIFS